MIFVPVCKQMYFLPENKPFTFETCSMHKVPNGAIVMSLTSTKTLLNMTIRVGVRGNKTTCRGAKKA